MADTRKEALSTYRTKRANATDPEEQQRLYAEFEEDDHRLFLEELKERFLNGPNKPHSFEGGGSHALFEAIDFCGRANVPMPAWVAKAFTEGFKRVHFAEARTWDAAFGRPWPKSTKFIAVRRRLRMMTMIYERVLALHDDHGLKIDNSLFEKVGKEFGIKRSLCSKLYLQERHRFGDVALARLPRKR